MTTPTDPPAPDDAELSARVGDVVKAAVNAGTALARSVARATGDSADGEHVSDNGVAELVRAGVGAVSGVVRLVITDVGRGVRGSRSSSDEAGADGGRNGPEVHAGSVLRVPLMVQNQGSAPLAETGFVCLEVQRLEGEEGPGPTVEDVRFVPETLSVGARDFEKLTVLVTAPPDARPGSYRVRIAALQGGFQADIDFSVV